MLTFLSTARLQEFDNQGRLLAGGKIYSYALGTSTPKALFKDVNGSAEHTNPIILDSIGSESIYMNGSYTLWLYDKNDLPLGPPIDVLGSVGDFITSAGGSWASNIVISVSNYADVRAITSPYAWVFCQGREYQADGGQGLFYLDQSSTDQDDDGVILAPQTTGRYIRYNVLDINPAWYGVKYGQATDQTIYLQASEAGSIRFAVPIKISDEIYLNQNFATAELTEYIFTDNAKLTSTLAIEFEFVTGSKLISCGRRVFGNSVQPKFNDGTTSQINLSWFDADTDDGRFNKFVLASDTTTIYSVNEDMEIGIEDVEIPNNSVLRFENFSQLSVTSAVAHNFVIPRIDDLIPTSAIYFPTSGSVGSISIPQINPKFYCAGVTSADNYIPLLASFKSGDIILDNLYRIDKPYTITNDLTIVGPEKNLVNISAIDNVYGLIIETPGNMITTTSASSVLFEDVFVGFSTSALSATYDIIGTLAITSGTTSATSASVYSGIFETSGVTGSYQVNGTSGTYQIYGLPVLTSATAYTGTFSSSAINGSYSINGTSGTYQFDGTSATSGTSGTFLVTEKTQRYSKPGSLVFDTAYFRDCYVYSNNFSDVETAYILGNNITFDNGVVYHSVTIPANSHLNNVKTYNPADPVEKTFYQNNTSFRDVYLENEKNLTSYDNLLKTDVNGLVYSNTTANLTSAFVNNISATNTYSTIGTFTTLSATSMSATNVSLISSKISNALTKIQFNWRYSNLEGRLVDIYRNGVFVETQAVTHFEPVVDAYYLTRAEDTQFFEITTTSADEMLGTSWIIPVVQPNTTESITVIKKSTEPLYVGDYSGYASTSSWNNKAVVNTVTGYYVSGKWAF